jgi:signal transduction histidine kinase
VLHNALKHSEQGGTVTVRAGHDSLGVQDEGSGISEEDLARVFEPLYRGAAGCLRSDSQSAGLGLPVSRTSSSG